VLKIGKNVLTFFHTELHCLRILNLFNSVALFGLIDFVLSLLSSS